MNQSAENEGITGTAHQALPAVWPWVEVAGSGEVPSSMGGASTHSRRLRAVAGHGRWHSCGLLIESIQRLILVVPPWDMVTEELAFSAD